METLIREEDLSKQLEEIERDGYIRRAGVGGAFYELTEQGRTISETLVATRARLMTQLAGDLSQDEKLLLNRLLLRLQRAAEALE